ncbi:MAG: reductase [Pseudomonadota bacterium]
MTRSVAIIGAGQIGYAASDAFLWNDWDVTVYARTRPDWLQRDVRFEQHVLGENPAPEADVVLDTIAFDEDDIARYDPEKIGRLIVISSASVYCDDQGRTLDEAAQNGFPEFDGPITEDQSTVAPGPETYSTRKVRMENKAREMFGDRATTLRPCAIHGLWSRHLREWWFVKRLIDGRTHIPLANRGESRFHTTSARMIGEFAVHAADHSLGGIVNLGDEDAPSVLQIGQSIAALFGQESEWIPVEGYPDSAIGRTPWSVPLPFLVSSEKARASGFTGIHTYADSTHAGLFHLRDDPPHDWRATFPQLAAYPWDLFDYDAEDRFLASL